MKIKFGNVHKLRYKVLSTFLSLAVLFTGTGLWYSYVLNNDLNAEAAGKANSLTDEGNTLLIDTTLYDYFYDAGNGGTYAVGQGGASGADGGSQWIGGYYDPYTNFNTAISNWWATSGLGSKLNTPLYFGNFYDSAPSYNNFNVVANNSVRTSDYGEDKSLAQKVTPGLLKNDVSTSDMDSLPYFNPTFLSKGSTGPVTAATATATINSIKVYWGPNSSDISSESIFTTFGGDHTFKWGQKVSIYNASDRKIYIALDGTPSPSSSVTNFYYENQFWSNSPNHVVMNYTVGGRTYDYTFTGLTGSSSNWHVNQSMNSSYRSQFNETVAAPGAYGDSYPGLTFPFRKTISSGDTYWEFSGNQMPINLDKATNQLQYKYYSDVAIKYYGVMALQSTSDYSPDRSPQRRAAFFPFDSGNEELKDVDYGFGAKFNINFNLTDDGKTINGNDIIFEFKGDDDVWVFIDDKLVLDMGGDHGESHGIINFANQTSKVETGEKNDFGSNTTAQTNLRSVLRNSKSNRHTMTIYYMERGMFESNLYMKFNFIPNSNVMSVSEQTHFTGVNAGLRDKTQEVANKDVFTYTLSNKTNISNPQIPGNGLKYPSNNNYVRRNLTGGYLGLQGNPSGGTGNTYNFSAGGVSSSFVDVSNTAYLLNDDYAQATTGGTAPYWGNENPDGSTRVVGKTDADGRVNLLYGQRAEFDGQFIAGSQMKVVPEDDLYTYTGWDVDGTNSYTNGFIFSPQTRSRSDYYNTTVTVTVKDGEDEQNIFTGSLEDYKTDTIFNNGYNFGETSSLKTIEAEQLFKNTVKTGSIKVTKALKNNTETPKSQNGAGNAQFTIKVELTDLFGVAGENVTDYGSIEVIGDHGTTLSAGGTYTLENGESFTINGIPVGTKVTISELNSASGKYFDAAKAEITPNGLTEVKETETGFTVTNVRKTGTITINKEFAAGSTEKTGEFTARVTFDTNDNPENIDLVNYNISYTDSTHPTSTKAVLTNDGGSSYFEVTISDTTPAEIKNVPYGIKYKVAEVLTGDQTNAGWQTPTMTVGSVNYDGSPQTFEGDVTYTITNNKQETVDIYVQKAFADLSGTEKTETISEWEEIAATRTVTFKVYIPQNSAPDFVTYTYYTKGGVANTKTVKKGTDDYDISYELGKYRERYCITVSDPQISLSTVKDGKKILTLPNIKDLAVVVAEDTTDKKWVPTYSNLTDSTESDTATFDGTTNRYNFKIVNKPADVTDTYTLKVRKDIINSETDDNHKPFKVDLKLKFSAADKSDVVQLMEGYEFKYTAWIKQSSGLTKLNYKKDIPITVEWEEYDPAEGTMTCTLEGLNIQKQERYPYKNSNNYRDSEYRVDIPKAFADFVCNAELVSAYEDLNGSVEINKNEWLDPTYNYNEEPSSDGKFTNGKISDTGDNILTITNNRRNVEAYLTITKYIDSLHYGENDNAHRFAGGTGIPNIDSNTKPAYDYDPFHYLQYTQAEQLFEFKITEYEPAPSSTTHEYHVFLKFGPDSKRIPVVNYNGNDYYYSQSKMFKVKPGYSYTVEEVGANNTQNTGISWRYKYDGNQVEPGKGVTYDAADGKCKYIGDRKTTTLESTFNFYNSRTEGSQTIESDQSSIINHIDYTRN